MALLYYEFFPFCGNTGGAPVLAQIFTINTEKWKFSSACELPRCSDDEVISMPI